MKLHSRPTTSTLYLNLQCTLILAERQRRKPCIYTQVHVAQVAGGGPGGEEGEANQASLPPTHTAHCQRLIAAKLVAATILNTYMALAGPYTEHA